MKNLTPLVLFFFTSFLLLSESYAIHTISANIAIKDGDTIVSNGEVFELGFFSPNNTKNRYLGIWYKKISYGTVVWVANRETPIPDTSGMLKVEHNGRLMILNGNNTKIWSSNSMLSDVKNVNPVAQLLDNGNLVVWDKNVTNQNMIWQSFDYPGNTLLPGMKFGKDLVRGIDRYLTSWKSHDDPSPGLYEYSVDTNGYPQVFQKQGSVLRFRVGPWNGIKFRGLPMDQPNRLYTSEFIVNQKEIYVKYTLKSSGFTRAVMRSDGNTVHLQWVERTQDWILFGNPAVDSCGRYGLCGPYGSCSINKYPPCSCMEGFEPKVKQEWNSGDWSKGCQHKESFDCGNEDGFKKVAGMKYPDTRRSWYNVSMTLGECEMACRRNCSCTAYANLYIINGGSGCLLWFGELIDTREYDEHQDFYIRMAASALVAKGVTEPSEIKGILTAVLVISSAALLLSFVAFAYRNRKIRKHMKVKGKRKHTHYQRNISIQMEDVDELPFFSLNEIVKATDNFITNNKIGEGGFGPVYKGVLEDGRAVAVKRLSETSQQGLDEFKNEVICIAKLQHRNLVKLLGYCIHGIEMILIYEYMPNKSLDSFIFDETKSSILDWPQRSHIIHGMARGILYLHQDSRFQIIHRDLKPGNILLDADMNPKISDFGLARKFVGSDNAAKTKKVVGTYGYISPEYAVQGRFSIKSDVFSFGVLVLEIVSGKRNREFSHDDHRDNLLGHAWRLYKLDKSIELTSASLRHSCVISEVQRLIHIGLLCVQHHAEDRPTMLSVVLMLVGEGALPQPKQPAFFTEQSHRELESVPSVNDYMITLLHAR